MSQKNQVFVKSYITNLNRDSTLRRFISLETGPDINLDLGSFFFLMVNPELLVKYNWKFDLLKSL
jgi:hypothetical protein